MIVTVLGVGSATLVGALDAARVEYTRPQPGIETSAWQVVEIPKFSVPALAGIIISWLNERPSRIVTVTTKDGARWHTRGKSVAEVEKLLTGAKEMMAVEMEKPDTDEK
jgi:Effector Associated Constant Component 1